MSTKTFSGNNFVFHTPGASLTKFSFDDKILEMNTPVAKFNNVACSSISDRDANNRITFESGQVCNFHGQTITNATVVTENTEYVDPIYRSSVSGTFELTTDGLAPGTNRFLTVPGQMGQLRIKINIRKTDFSRYYMVIAELSYINNAGTITLSNVNLLESMRVGTVFPITITISGNYIIVVVDSGADTVSAKAWIEHYQF